MPHALGGVVGMGRYEETSPAVGRDARVGGGVGIGHEECFEGIAFMGSR